MKGVICLSPVRSTVEDQTCLSDLTRNIRKGGQHLAGVSLRGLFILAENAYLLPEPLFKGLTQHNILTDLTRSLKSLVNPLVAYLMGQVLYLWPRAHFLSWNKKKPRLTQHIKSTTNAPTKHPQLSP